MGSLRIRSPSVDLLICCRSLGCLTVDDFFRCCSDRRIFHQLRNSLHVFHHRVHIKVFLN
ncbi:hypothetical protein ZOSMA_101G00650 [Zostera marina]|uniref:Uncharacterized protein n=1 Tax=Zostera marina TaxID=29655 RepID=A0A0K9Q5D5_ZOSMR|nr:hypothetical protein ZOSMA_101G00650 [Zostera marina]